MVHPLDTTVLFVGPPTEELLRLRPILRRALWGLGCVVMVELVAGRILEGIANAIPFFLGCILYKRDVDGLVKGLLQLTLVTVIIMFIQFISLFQLLEQPGVGNFMSTTCVFPPGSLIDEQGKKNDDPVDLCGWSTPMGNIALLFALFFGFRCARLSWQMYKSMMQARNRNFAIMDLENPAARHRIARQMAFSRPSEMQMMGSPMGLGFRREATAAAFAIDETGERGEPGERGGESSSDRAAALRQNQVLGFTPYSGQGHHLTD